MVRQFVEKLAKPKFTEDDKQKVIDCCVKKKRLSKKNCWSIWSHSFEASENLYFSIFAYELGFNLLLQILSYEYGSGIESFQKNYDKTT